MTFRFQVTDPNLIASMLAAPGTLLESHSANFTGGVVAVRELAVALCPQALRAGCDVILVSNRSVAKPEDPKNLRIVCQHDYEDMNDGAFLGLAPYIVLFDNYDAVKTKLSFDRLKEMSQKSGMRIFRVVLNDGGFVYTNDARLEVG